MAQSKWDRVSAALEGGRPDKVPLTFWMHFPEVDRSARGLVRATLDLYRRYDLDLIKVMFRSSFGLEDWGVHFGSYHPTRGSWQTEEYVVHTPEDWGTIEVLPPDRGVLGEQLEVLSQLRKEVGPDVPVLATLFSPSMLAVRLSGRARFLEHWRTHRDDVERALKVIGETVMAFGLACLRAGADGIFYAIELGSGRAMPHEEYRAIGERYDRPILAEIHERSRLTMLHLHGEDLAFSELVNYPSHVVNWYDRCAGPSLRDARAVTSKCLAAGIDHERTLMLDTPEEIASEVRAAVAEVDGRGLILAPGCGIPITVPERSLRALVEARNSLA